MSKLWPMQGRGDTPLRACATIPPSAGTRAFDPFSFALERNARLVSPRYPPCGPLPHSRQLNAPVPAAHIDMPATPCFPARPPLPDFPRARSSVRNSATPPAATCGRRGCAQSFPNCQMSVNKTARQFLQIDLARPTPLCRTDDTLLFQQFDNSGSAIVADFQPALQKRS